MGWLRTLLYLPLDLLASTVMWVYFLFGFLFGFWPRYLLAPSEASARALHFQRLHAQFFSGFFALARRLLPRLELRIAPEVRALRGRILVANHLSHMDPLLLVSLFPAQKTIIKASWFRLPIFGRFVAGSGYMPSGEGAWISTGQVLPDLRRYLEGGGNLFVFPEGTRSRDGRIGPFMRGAFVLAREARVPIALVRIRGTDRFFPRGAFYFRVCQRAVVEVDLLSVLHPDYEAPEFSVKALAELARSAYIEAGSGAEDCSDGQEPK